jgi:hypothetical protein
MDLSTWELLITSLLTLTLFILSVDLLRVSRNERTFHYTLTLGVFVSILCHLYLASTTHQNAESMPILVLVIEQLLTSPFHLVTAHLLTNAQWTLILFDVVVTFIMNACFLISVGMDGEIMAFWRWIFFAVGVVSWGVLADDVFWVGMPYLEKLEGGKSMEREREKIEKACLGVGVWVFGMWFVFIPPLLLVVGFLGEGPWQMLHEPFFVGHWLNLFVS